MEKPEGMPFGGIYLSPAILETLNRAVAAQVAAWTQLANDGTFRRMLQRMQETLALHQQVTQVALSALVAPLPHLPQLPPLPPLPSLPPLPPLPPLRIMLPPLPYGAERPREQDDGLETENAALREYAGKLLRYIAFLRRRFPFDGSGSAQPLPDD
jgi:hypothetical protein